MKKHVAVVAALLLLAFAFSLGAAPPEKKLAKKAQKLMTKAEAAIRDKQPAQALELLQQVVALEPGSAKVRYYLGVLLQQNGRTDEAIAEVEEALRLQADFANARPFLRKVLLEAGREANSRQEFAKSNGYLAKLLEQPPAPPAEENGRAQALARFLLGFNHFNLKQLAEARDHFAACLAVEGLRQENAELFANATYFLGMIDYMQDRFVESAQSFKTYLSLQETAEAKPQFYGHANYFVGANLFRILEARVAKGDMKDVQAATDEIIPYLEKAIAEKIPSEDPHVMLGNCYVYRNQVDRAVETYEALIAAFPQSPQLENYRVFLAELQKSRPKAKKK